MWSQGKNTLIMRFKIIIFAAFILLSTSAAESQAKKGFLQKMLEASSQKSSTNRGSSTRPSQPSRNVGTQQNQMTSGGNTRDLKAIERQEAEDKKRAEEIAFASTLSPIVHEEWGDFKWGTDKFRDYELKGGEKSKALLPKDAEEYSDALFEAAMENNDVSLFRKLGHCYLFGLGISKNDDKASQMYAKAAELGDWDGLMRCIASCGIRNQASVRLIYNDKLQSKALSEGYAPFIYFFDVKKAAELGYPQALYDLAIRDKHRSGNGNTKDDFDIDLLEKIKFYPDAAYAGAYYYLTQKDQEKAYSMITQILWNPEYERTIKHFKYGEDWIVRWNVGLYHQTYFEEYFPDELLREYGLQNDETKTAEVEQVLKDKLIDQLLYRNNHLDYCTKLVNSKTGKLLSNRDLYINTINCFSRDMQENYQGKKYIKVKADENNAFAQFVLYYFSSDSEEILLKSANNGFAPAQYAWGRILNKKNNHILAESYYQKAISNGFTSDLIEAEYKSIKRKLNEQDQIKAFEKEIASVRSSFVSKYGASIQESLDNGKITVGMPISALTDFRSKTNKQEYKYSLSIDHGSSKCYDVYCLYIGWVKIGFVWVADGKITSYVRF